MITSTTALIYRMVIAAMAGQPIEELYEEYVRARYLHVTIAEILESKKKNRLEEGHRDQAATAKVF